ncbi:MAG TPA: maleylpyruvate isomerase family mycothiol-dependent enzyme [Nocardioides sp.]|nr:maleylpyruvate isomerase family mycothiol-dependent enzyme [Nocardioides sp.]
MDVQDRIAANRRRLADFFDSLDEDQLKVRSLCEGWTVRDVLGHLVMPLAGNVTGFLVQLVRARGSIDRASAALARELGRRPVAELTGMLRERADEVIKVPGVGPMGQMADGCVHLRDCARPLGLPDEVSLDDWRVLLEWLSRGVVGLVPKRRLQGLSLLATDQEWSWGSGPELAGPSEALAMAVTGRPVALADLTGPGVQDLRDRLARQ